jgi:PAAR motif
VPGQGRLGDKANISADAHGCPGCPHPGTGPAIMGSPDVFVNGRPALRVDDMGIHAVCCGPNMWKAQQGSATVFINGKAAFRMNDPSKHCGGQGQLIEGSADVIVGDAGGGGSGGGGGGGGGSSSGGGGGGGGGGSGGAAGSASGGGSASGSGAGSGGGAAGGAGGSDPGGGASPPADDKRWVEIALVDGDGQPMSDVKYEITTPDGRVLSGTLGSDGVARVDDIDPGQCKIRFPDLDASEWQPQ